ncbi:MAG: ribonuclease P protein subunit [Candidatus Heimdallarchaeota archaeon]|nr:ribonuclease P protein subunit [Candidatus Heimdallarchaeota archaeon]
MIGIQSQITCYGKTYTGEILNESKNTIRISTKKGVKIIPKDQAIIQIQINDQKINIHGNQLKGRHEDRIKHRMKRKW